VAYISSLRRPSLPEGSVCCIEIFNGVSAGREINMEAVQTMHWGSEAQGWRVAMTGEVTMMSKVNEIAI
jgi:hypothetical protein